VNSNVSQNAFSEKLGPYGFDFYSLFVPDLLHEFELGVWKVVFTHLMRLLYACGGDGIQMLNERSAILIVSFGWTILIAENY
jgi:hypothetical protein